MEQVHQDVPRAVPRASDLEPSSHQEAPSPGAAAEPDHTGPTSGPLGSVAPGCGGFRMRRRRIRPLVQSAPRRAARAIYTESAIDAADHHAIPLWRLLRPLSRPAHHEGRPVAAHEGARTNQAPAGIARARTRPVRASGKATRPRRTAATDLIHRTGQLSTGFAELCTTLSMGEGPTTELTVGPSHAYPQPTCRAAEATEGELCQRFSVAVLTLEANRARQASVRSGPPNRGDAQGPNAGTSPRSPERGGSRA